MFNTTYVKVLVFIMYHILLLNYLLLERKYIFFSSNLGEKLSPLNIFQ